MFFSEEIQSKTKKLLKDDNETIEKILSGDAEAIRKIGSIAQQGINPENVVRAFESNDPDAMKHIYNQSKNLVELRELYQELCYEFYKNIVPQDKKKKST